MKNYFKRLFYSEKKKGFLFTTNNLGTQTGNGMRISDRLQGNPNNYFSIENSIAYTQEVAITSNFQTSNNAIKKVELLKDERKEVQPIEVFNEIKKEGLEPDFSNLDEKIK